MLYTSKSGTHVFVPLPPQVAEAVRTATNYPDYALWNGESRDEQRKIWWSRLRRVFDAANLGKRCHPHMLRDTFAVELLLAGVPLEEVSMLLGHRSTKVTEKHYMPWVKARQDKLSESVKKSWTAATPDCSGTTARG